MRRERSWITSSRLTLDCSCPTIRSLQPLSSTSTSLSASHLLVLTPLTLLESAVPFPHRRVLPPSSLPQPLPLILTPSLHLILKVLIPQERSPPLLTRKHTPRPPHRHADLSLYSLQLPQLGAREVLRCREWGAADTFGRWVCCWMDWQCRRCAWRAVGRLCLCLCLVGVRGRRRRLNDRRDGAAEAVVEVGGRAGRLAAAGERRVWKTRGREC